MITRKEFLKAGATFAAAAAWPGWAEQPVVLADVQPASGAREVATTCNMCVLGCSVLATREGDRVVSLRGNPHSPVNRGRLCAKGQAGLYKAVHPERLGYPLVRVGARGEGKWKRVTWGEALRVVAAGLRGIRRDFGPRAIALWQNLNMDRPEVFRRFVYALGSPNFIGHVSTCDASKLIAGGLTFGPDRPMYDYSRARCIVAVGINPLGAKDLVRASREIMEAKQRGAVLIAVDPRLSETAARADLWLPVRPGTDGVLLGGWANWLIQKNRFDQDFVAHHTLGFEPTRRFLEQFTVERVCRETGIAPERFLKAAEWMAGGRTLVATGRGVITHRDGTQAARMAEIVNALLGAIDREGGVLMTVYPSIQLSEPSPVVKPPGGQRIDGSPGERIPLPVGPRAQNPATFFGLSHAVPSNVLQGKPYPLKALIFNAVNPVYSLPQGRELVAALERLELVVSMDAFLSETTRYADVVLPASTYLEGRDLWFPLGTKVSLRQPVIRPRVESRPSQEIILALAKAMGLSEQFPFRSYEDFLRQELRGSGVELEALSERGFLPFSAEEVQPGRRRRGGFLTPSGKVELVSSLLAAAGHPHHPEVARPAEQREDFPFHLVTYKLPFHTQSATGENPYLAQIQRDNPVLMNPEAAAALGVVSGQQVRIESARGELVATVRVTEGVRPDTLALAHHFGHTAYSRIAAGRGVNGNAVIADGTDPVGGNLAFNDTRVRVRPA